jgi:hypothetical protein
MFSKTLVVSLLVAFASARYAFFKDFLINVVLTAISVSDKRTLSRASLVPSREVRPVVPPLSVEHPSPPSSLEPTLAPRSVLVDASIY